MAAGYRAALWPLGIAAPSVVPPEPPLCDVGATVRTLMPFALAVAVAPPLATLATWMPGAVLLSTLAPSATLATAVLPTATSAATMPSATIRVDMPTAAVDTVPGPLAEITCP